jgi:hypothetical protein
MDTSTRKIVDYEVVEQTKQNVKGNTSEPSGNMEKAGVMAILKRWKNDKRVERYVHDDDGRTRKAVQDAGWDILEFLDPGHAAKNMDKRIRDYSHAHGNLFKGIQERLQQWFRELIYYELTPEDKGKLWLNTWKHFTGDHSCCVHKKDAGRKDVLWKPPPKVENALGLFQQFLVETVKYTQRIDKRYTTQAVESFNQTKTIFLPKDQKWSSSQSFRIEAAILKWNDPSGWEKGLEKELKLQAQDPLFQKLLEKETRKGVERNDARREEEAKKKRNVARKAKTKAWKKSDAKADGYGSKRKDE